MLKAASHHIPSGRHRINTEPVPTEILENMRTQDDLRSSDSTSPVLPEMNDEITRITNEHKRKKLRQFVETLDHKTDPTKLWRMINAIDGKSTPKAENVAITFDGSQVSSPKQIANYFNRQFTTPKLGRHTSSRETRLVSREIKRKLLTSAVTFTTYQVTKGISICRKTRAFGPDTLSIFHLNHLGSKGIVLTALFNDSVRSCRLPSIWKSSQSRNQARTLLSALLIGISRSPIQQRKLWRFSYFQASTTTCFHTQTNTVSDPDTLPLLLCYNCFNQSKPPHRTVCVAVGLTAAFDTVNHNVLLSKIVRSTLPEATCRWLLNYLRGRQSITSCRGVKSKARIVHTVVSQGSKISPTLFSFI